MTETLVAPAIEAPTEAEPAFEALYRSSRDAEALEAQLADVRRLGRFATVSVDVTSDGTASDDGGWSLGVALVSPRCSCPSA